MSVWDWLPSFPLIFSGICFLITILAMACEQDVQKQVRFGYVVCMIPLFGCLAWTLEAERIVEANIRHPDAEDVRECGTIAAAQEMAHSRADEHRAKYLSQRHFVVDGLNFWPIVILAVVTGIVLYPHGQSVAHPKWFVPAVLFFEASSFAALTANALVVYLISYSLSVLAMGTLLSLWGGLERRALADRFLLTQFCGSSLVMLGFAMLTVTIPWMKIEDSPTRPLITDHLSTIIYETQKWMTSNEPALRYASDIFPWLLLVLSLGFAVQFGLFPFHSAQIGVIAQAPGNIVALFLAGTLSMSSTGWLRFVLPLAPDAMISFDWLMLAPSLGGAIWGASRALTPATPQQKGAYLFLSLAGISLLGCYTFTRFGTSATWLMQQQLTIGFCLIFQAIESSSAETTLDVSQNGITCSGFSTRSLLLATGLFSVGLFASGYIIESELFNLYFQQLGNKIEEETEQAGNTSSMRALLNTSLFSAMVIFLAFALISVTIAELLIRHRSSHGCSRLPWKILVIAAIVVNLFPGFMLRQCEPEFARVFRQYERTPSASSAEDESAERQSSP